MKSYTQITLHAVILLLLVLQGCSSVTSNNEENSNNITEEDLETAAHIVGESLSERHAGAMASLYDALSTVSPEGMQYLGASDVKAKQPGYTQKSISDYEYEYDPETGTHTIDFTRIAERDDYSKSVIGHLEFIFADQEGTFVVFPRANKDSIETVDFKGTREGESEGPRVESTFTRIDTFFVSGLHETSDFFQFEGTHYREGNRNWTPENRPEIMTEYEVNFEFIDITIDKAVVEENQTLEEGVTGTVNYSLTFTGTNGDQQREKMVEGTVEFMGDGTGLLRFKKFAKVFRLSLYDGEPTDE